MQRMRQNTTLASVVLIGLAIAFGGCGGGSQAPLTAPAPVSQNATVSGQYSLVLTSTNGRGTIHIYTNITQTGKTFAGATDTLVCPSNDLSQCQGQGASSGAVSGANVTIIISFPSAGQADTVTMVGTAGISLAGTYTDSLGDAGTWTASPTSSLSGTYNGTFNSTSNALSIAPAILISLAQDASFHLTGAATITNSPCITSLNLAGVAIGGAFSLTDATSKANIIALPTDSGFIFSYTFEPSAPSCAGDFGRGTLTGHNPWGY